MYRYYKTDNTRQIFQDNTSGFIVQFVAFQDNTSGFVVQFVAFQDNTSGFVVQFVAFQDNTSGFIVQFVAFQDNTSGFIVQFVTTAWFRVQFGINSTSEWLLIARGEAECNYAIHECY